MVWCYYCGKTITHPNYMDGKICCTLCGRVLDEDNFSQEPTFVKNSSGQSQLSGSYVNTIQSEFSASRARILKEAYDGIESIMYALDIDGGESIARPACTLYKIAVERQFTRGRRKELVEAACLYIICRQNQKPFLLIDFSEHLRVNVYVLGAVFLQLCKLLSLLEDPIVQKPVDPSLFIHRFTDRLFGGQKPNVSKTALRILYHMKRDWMQTGRKPSGLCGAALYISSLSHGLKCSKAEIIKVVHVCEATLTKRLIEFENTESGGLTVEEFNARAKELEKEERLMKSLDAGSQKSGTSELLCEHKGSGKYFRHGLCQSCYTVFVELSGGLDGGSEPPAFQRAEKERLMAKEAAAKGSENLDSTVLSGPAENESKPSNHRKERNSGDASQWEGLQSAEAGLEGSTFQEKISHDDQTEGMQDDDDSEKSESLSDIDDTEVNGYLHTEEEKELKKLIWETMNKEYIEEQRAKEEAAQRKTEVDYSNCSGDVEGARKLRDSVMEAHEKLKKEKRQKRAEDLKNLRPAQTPGEAAKQMLKRKVLSSKIRWDAVKDLLDDPVEIPEDIKKSRLEPAESDLYDDDMNNGKEDLEVEEADSEIIEEEEEIDFF